MKSSEIIDEWAKDMFERAAKNTTRIPYVFDSMREQAKGLTAVIETKKDGDAIRFEGPE